jgi:hypothetical protein
MTTQHTPGPWKYLRTSGFDYGSTAYWIPGICGNVKDEANARLIAAAPDLLEALSKIEAACAVIPEGLEGYLEPLSDALADARAAIAKATGAMK